MNGTREQGREVEKEKGIERREEKKKRRKEEKKKTYSTKRAKDGLGDILPLRTVSGDVTLTSTVPANSGIFIAKSSTDH